MKQWLVDTNVLLDVIGGDEVHGTASRFALERCAEAGVLVINPIIYSEVSTFIESLEELDELLPADLFRRDPIPWPACFLAGKAHYRYRRSGGDGKRMLADFLIGAHAAVEGMGLITRDGGYARYFELELLNPTPPRPGR
ncbi:MAG: type II toxin-antitoxin system VapC family toxin [Gemmatimonadota bacterium]